MNLGRIYAVFLRQIYLFRSNPTRLASVFIWLIIDITQWGFISKYLGTFGQSTFNFLSAILGAIILYGFMARIQQGVMTSFLEDIWSQNFINYFASPLKLREYLSGLVLTSVLTGIASFTLVVIIASVGFGYDIFLVGLLLIPFITILFLFGVTMGIFVSGMIFRLGPSAEWLGWPIPLILSVFSGVYYPISTLPGSFQVISKCIPASYVFESLRIILSNRTITTGLITNLITGIILAFAYLMLAYLFFIRVYNRNIESGAIARFSAEY